MRNARTDPMGSSEMGQKFWGSFLEPFFILQLLGSKLSLIEGLQSWEIGIAKISAPSFRNLPDKLSMPAAINASCLRWV